MPGQPDRCKPVRPQPQGNVKTCILNNENRRGFNNPRRFSALFEDYSFLSSTLTSGAPAVFFLFLASTILDTMRYAIMQPNITQITTPAGSIPFTPLQKFYARDAFLNVSLARSITEHIRNCKSFIEEKSRNIKVFRNFRKKHGRRFSTASVLRFFTAN